MKTVTVNAYMIISMIITMIAFYSGLLPEGTDPKIILWMTAAGSLLSLFLKQFFPSGTWTGKGAPAVFWIVNVGVFITAVFTSWHGIGLLGASLTSAVVGTINILLSYFGSVPVANGMTKQ